jgi:hypothetical protein
MSHNQQPEEKGPVSFYLPKQIIQAIDENRGRVSRSTFVAIILERVLPKRRKAKVA